LVFLKSNCFEIHFFSINPPNLFSKQFDLRKTKRYRGDHAYVNIAEAAPDIRLGGFMEKKWISKQFDLRKTKRYRGDHAYVNIAEAAPDIRLGGFMEKKWISKQFD
jgi:hypothetical protein